MLSYGSEERLTRRRLLQKTPTRKNFCHQVNKNYKWENMANIFKKTIFI
jgi:hypothetical protein